MKLEIGESNGLVARIGSFCLWLGCYRGPMKPIDHPEGKAMGAWAEDREWFFLAGPLVCCLSVQ